MSPKKSTRRPLSTSIAAVLTAAAVLVGASSANAANGTWTNLTAGGSWSATSNWSGGTVADGSGFTADFSTLNITADNTVHMDGSHTLTSLIFGDLTTASNNWILDNNGSAGNILTLAGTTPTITVNNQTATISAVIDGTAGLTKAGNGTLVLSAANTYSGVTTVNRAADVVGIAVTNASAFGTSSVLITSSTTGFNGGISVGNGVNIGNALTLKTNAANRSLLMMAGNSTWSGNISIDNSAGTGAGFSGITVDGTVGAKANSIATAAVISGNITQTAAGTNTNGLVLRGGGDFGKITGSVSMGTATVQLLDNTSWEFSNVSNTWGTLDISNASAIVYAGTANTLSSTGVVSSTNGGTLRLNNMVASTTTATATNQTIAGLSGSVNVGLQTAGNGTSGTATLTLNTTANQSSTGVISNAIALVKTGSATQTLSGANSYTGGTTISGGTLQFAKTASFYNNVVDATTAANLTVNTGATGAFNVGGTGEFSEANINTILGASNGTVGFNTGAILGLDTTSGNFTYATNLANPTGSTSLGLTKLGINTLTLTGTNTYTGKTFINGGVVNISADNNLGTAPGSAVADQLTFGGGSIQFGAPVTLAANRGVKLNSGATFDSNGNAVTVNGVISGAGALTKSGAGTLILSSANTYTGNTTVNAGTLQVGNANATNNKVTTLNGGNLTISSGVTYNIDNGLTFASNTNATVSAASGTASIQGFDVNGADIIVNTGVTASIDSSIGLKTNTFGIRIDNTGDLSVAGVISGAGSVGGGVINNGTLVGTDQTALYKLGAGTLTLTGASTFTGATGKVGATSVQNGTLKLSGGNDRLPAASAVYLGATTNTSGKLVLDGISQAITGLTTIGTGTANAVVGGSSTLSTLTVNNTNNYTFSGKLGGAGTNENNLALTKSGAGILTLTGANTYAGNTTISAGTLSLADNAQLLFVIGNGINNKVTGTGTFNLDGDFAFDLTGATTSFGDTWNVVDLAGLNETFSSLFSVVGFTDMGSDLWQTTAPNGATYQFSEVTGNLTVVPEPGALSALLGGMGVLVGFRRRRSA